MDRGESIMPVKNRERLAKELFGVSLDTLERMPERTLRFLRAVGTNLAIFHALVHRGYSPLIHAQAWNLLQSTGAIDVSGEPTGDYDPKVAGAVAEADQMDDIWIRVIRVSWKHDYPDQLDFVLQGIEPAEGMGAVLNMAQMTGRLSAMETSPERTGTRDQDTKALSLLAERGIGPSERAAAAALIETAMSTPQGVPRSPEELAAADEAYVRALGELRKWYELWSEMARIEVTRRDRLIQLGLAHRKTGGDDEEPI